jgi:FkbM family methyltransferase
MSGRFGYAAWLRFVKWQLKSRVLNRPIIHSWLAPCSFYVARGEHGLTGNIYVGLHEFADMGFLLHALKENDTFIDIGANSGSYTLLASAVVGAKSIAVEPVQSTYLRLKNNVTLNLIEDRVEILNLGIAAERGYREITKDTDSTNHFVISSLNYKTELVEVRTLDDIAKDVFPNLIKIDVEGWETEVLLGGKSTLLSPSLFGIIIELNGNGSRFGFEENELVEILRNQGFKPFLYRPERRSLTLLTHKNTESGNTLFLRDIDEVFSRLNSAPRRSLYGFKF